MILAVVQGFLLPRATGQTIGCTWIMNSGALDHRKFTDDCTLHNAMLVYIIFFIGTLIDDL